MCTCMSCACVHVHVHVHVGPPASRASGAADEIVILPPGPSVLYCIVPVGLIGCGRSGSGDALYAKKCISTYFARVGRSDVILPPGGNPGPSSILFSASVRAGTKQYGRGTPDADPWLTPPRQTMRDFLAGVRSASDWRTAIAALAGSSPPSSAAAPTSAASMRAAPTGEAAWCRCTLHSDSTAGCGALPAWLEGHTGREGELFFKVQDSAWGNAMMQLRDSLAIALVLNRRPVLVVDGSWSTLYRGNLSSLLEV